MPAHSVTTSVGMRQLPGRLEDGGQVERPHRTNCRLPATLHAEALDARILVSSDGDFDHGAADTLSGIVHDHANTLNRRFGSVCRRDGERTVRSLGLERAEPTSWPEKPESGIAPSPGP